MSGKFRYIYKLIILAAIILSPFASQAQTMEDYTAYPPFISSGTTPNLLLMIDNSGSMYDLTYVDEGNAPVRESSYCYDQTYSSSNVYTGYFERDAVYSYNFTDNRFEENNFPASCSHSISGELCVDIIAGSPSTINEFVAKGNYLNWLTASKLDIEKQILTGGKYDTTANEYISESRGCMGRRFLKEALTADYVEGGTNTTLGVAFSINGPIYSTNPTAPSYGGQTHIQIFEGDYNEALCQSAIEAINYASNPASIRKSVEDCLSYDPKAPAGSQYCLLDPAVSCTVDSDCDVVAEAGDCSSGKKSTRTCLAPASMVGLSCINDSDCDTVASSVGPCVGGSSKSADVNTKIVFNQSMQECWQVWSGSKTEIGHDAWSAEAPKCEEVYAGYKTCDGGTNDGNSCTSDLECVGGGTCVGGPDALRSGNPALVCNSSYAGYCATTSDNWATTTWVAKEYADPETCFRTKYLEFCGDVKVPPVVDPSDAPDDTSITANVPAIISDISIEAQLGSPIADITVKRYDTTAPTGLINDFSDSIRFGAMNFNFDGSDYECGLSTTDSLECPKVCSFTTSQSCSTDLDCPAGETCSSALGDKDGGEIIAHIGEGLCSVSGNPCVRDDQCAAGEECIATIGDHDSGLIKAIDDIRANTWTPFAESYYNAIAYYVKGSIHYTPDEDAISEDLNDDPGDSDDFDSTKNPIEFTCQKNNILIISDGSSTADSHDTMVNKAIDLLYNDQLADDPALCGNYSGSSYLDDLSYYAKNKNIFDPDDTDPVNDDLAQRITTYAVYTGTDTSTEAGECAPKTLMESTAANGGTTLYYPQDPEALNTSLNSAFQDVAKGSASGTAVSVLSTTGEGEGGIYQAYFYPEIMENNEPRKWIGRLHALFVDSNGNLREDTNGNATLDVSTDLIIEMQYSAEFGAQAKRYGDSDGDGEKDSATPVSTVGIDDINSIWRGGDRLWQTAAADRTIYSTVDGTTALDFISASASSFEAYLRAADSTEAENIINWIRGDDLTGITDAGHPSGYRKRDITINGVNNVWKLGDIIYSTPSSVGQPMENYDMLYNDASYYSFLSNHRNRRNVIYIGANDGMLHAFNGGFYSEKNNQFCTGSPDSNGNCTVGSYSLGDELWSFIPRGLLPHLKWLTDPGYTHVYYVDLKPKISDVKIFNSSVTHSGGWGTILIGGYRYGGKSISWTSGGSNYSASPEYYALDITDPLNPRLLWTFSDPELGLSMSYPSIAKIDSKWYAVIGSGPTDFDSSSNLTGFQNGNLFVLDLSNGVDGVVNSWALNSNYWKIPTGNATTFMSDPITVDVDMDYNIDVMYVPENYIDGVSGWNALMKRITTSNGTLSSPLSWTMSTLADVGSIAGANDDAKRITAAPSAAIDDMSNFWVYFGTGQFLGLNDKNQSETGAFYGVKDNCWKGNCSSESYNLMDVSASTIKTDDSVSGVSTCGTTTASTWTGLMDAANACEGWALYFKNLGESTDFLGSSLNHTGERVFSKPLIVGGLVAFGSYIPGSDECSYLGESNAYALYYKTGTAFNTYVFREQKDQASPSDTVARTVRLGEGMPSSPSGQREKDGSVNVFFQQSTGAIATAEHETPVSMKSALKGWRNEELP